MSCNPERLVFSKHQNTTRGPLIRCTKCSKYKTTGANPVRWDDFTRFQSTGIMPNIQSKSLETTVLALLDLTFHPPNGHNVHRQFTTLRPSEDTLSTLSTAPNGRGWSPGTPKSQRNRTKHPLAHVLIVGTSIHVIWGCTLFLRDPEFPDPTSQVNPDPDVSPGVSETNTWTILIRGVTTGNNNAKPVISVNQEFQTRFELKKSNESIKLDISSHQS